MPKFTDKFIATLKDDGRYTSDTDTGFQIKVEKGRKYFVYRYKLNNKRHDLTLGPYPNLSLKEARQRYAESRSSVLRGDNPTARGKKKLVSEINKKLPNFVCRYKPDIRQNYADSWPDSIDDQISRNDWNWQSRFNLESIVNEMLTNLE